MMMMEGLLGGRTGHVGDFDVGGLEALGYGLAETCVCYLRHCGGRGRLCMDTDV